MTVLHMPIDKVTFDIGRILTDFRKAFWYFSCINGSPIISIHDQMLDAVDKLNNGQCFIVASHCGYIAKQLHPDADIRIANGPSHEWIRYDNTDFDTLFPRGYPCPVSDMWNTAGDEDWSDIRTIPVGEERNKGRWDWVLIYTFKALCWLYRVDYPDYMKAFEEGARQTDIPCLKPEQEAEMQILYDKVQKMNPLHWPCIVPTREFRYPKCHPEWKPVGAENDESVVVVAGAIPVSGRYGKDELDRVRKLWDDKLAAKDQTEEPKEQEEELLPRSEWHYRQLIREMRVGNPFRLSDPLPSVIGLNTDGYVKVVKDIRNNSFGGNSMFSHPMFDNTRFGNTVRFKKDAFRNLELQDDHHARGIKVPYKELLDCITFPLISPKNKHYWRARLVIAAPVHGAAQIAVQLLSRYGEGQWITIPCTTANVKSTIERVLN